jgi:neurabin
VTDWTPQQVCHWLLALELDQYAPEFIAKGIDGNALLAMDSTKLKVCIKHHQFIPSTRHFGLQTLGVNSSKDRDLVRKKVKDLKSAMEKERKERERVQKERARIASSGKKKKFPFSK